MTPLQWLESLKDGVEVAALLMQCTTKQQAEAFYSRTISGYVAAKGMEYADAVAEQARALLEGVEQIRKGVVT